KQVMAFKNNCGKVKISLAKKKKSKRIATIRLKEIIPKADGYEIRFFANKKNATINRHRVLKRLVDSKSKLITAKSRRIQNKKVLYVRMRGYKYIGGKRVYSKKWSDVVRVKIAKKSSF
ncbi:MAG: hypothetical protein IKN54_07070, partial [Lachnospiraceae bacterium]|nr:hypothetical protein [Lachnospiraceae bacterium]